MDSLLVLSCDVDDYCKVFLPIWNRQLLALDRISVTDLVH